MAGWAARMSIQPSRVIDRIVRQVDASEWPPLPVRSFATKDETLLLYSAPVDPLRFSSNSTRFLAVCRARA